ncbi:MAG: transporter [Burkholderiales bacterium]|nr:transporter [Phycisphaerae bacterium]
MSTDRPDTTESPYSVDAGHVQVELSFVDYASNDDDGERTNTLGVLPTNIKVGLLNNVDVQFVFTPYERIETETDDSSQSQSGLSDDTQIRLKLNLLGNDGGETALAIMPFIKLPTGSDQLSNDHVEGGIMLPLAISLPNDFSLGLMAKLDYVYNDAADDYGFNLVHTATIGHPIAGDLSGYVEYIGIAPHETSASYQAIASGGLTYAINDHWILDCGGTVGISDSADDFTVIAGTSFRF